MASSITYLTDWKPMVPREEPQGPPSVLLVEDNEDDVLLTLRAFRKHALGMDGVQVARDGADALDYLFARGAHAARDPQDLPNLVLLDINLPRMTGLQVLEALRADPRTRLVPVVMLTSSAAECDLEDSYRLGANSFIQKPIASSEFDEVVAQVLNYWLDLNQGPNA